MLQPMALQYDLLISPNDAIAVVNATITLDGWVEGELIFADKMIWQSAIELNGDGVQILVEVPKEIQRMASEQIYFDQGFRICQKARK